MKISWLLIVICGLVFGFTDRTCLAAKPIDVYLIGGQSNATGQGYMANLPEKFSLNKDVLLFHSAKPHLDSGEKPNTWVPLRQASESPDRFGPELGFGNRIAELKTDRAIALIKHAHSGTNLFRDWNPGKDAADKDHFGPQYKVFIETVQLGLKELKDQDYEPTIRGMIWQQGESDSKDEETATSYSKNLAQLIARVREQFETPDMLFVYGFVLPPPNAGKARDLVRQGQRDVDQNSGSPLAVKRAFVISTDDLSQRADDRNSRYPNDHNHFGTAGTLELGRRMAERMIKELNDKR